MKPKTSRWVGTLALMFIIGCGEAKTYPVKGEVVYADNDEPVRCGLTIFFESTTPPHQRSSGLVDADGKFYTSRRAPGSVRSRPTRCRANRPGRAGPHHASQVCGVRNLGVNRERASRQRQCCAHTGRARCEGKEVKPGHRQRDPCTGRGPASLRGPANRTSPITLPIDSCGALVFLWRRSRAGRSCR
jgi:hypothetical protein